MDDASRHELLLELRGLGSDADAHPSMLKVFLPLPAHRQALEPNTLIVRGKRGSGKTALFHFLRELSERGIAPSSVLGAAVVGRWVEGFSERGKLHPGTDVLDQWGESTPDEAMFRAFWLGHLAGRLSTTAGTSPLPAEFAQAWSRAPGDPGAWVPLARQQIAALTTWLDRLDDATGPEPLFVSYDHLDKIGLTRPDLRRRFASALLGLWLSLSNRLANVKGKVFLREDLFQDALFRSADASKLEARSVQLHWSAEALYRMLLRHMGASAGLRTWLETGNGKAIFRHDPVLGYMPPETLPEEGGSFSQKALVERLAGTQMGEGVKKGYTYRWIPNHLQDARGAIVPRSLLNLVAFAAETALTRGPRAGNSRLLHYSELRDALERTSRCRATELAEEHKVVRRVESLRGLVLLARRDTVIQRLSMRPPVDDGFDDDGVAAFDELERIGVLKTREDGRVDMPDIYRFGFGIKRKGGEARPR